MSEPQAPIDPEMIRQLVAEELATYFGLVGPANDGAILTRVERLATAIDSVNYINAAAPGCPRYMHSHHLLDAAMASRRVDGQILEFGVYSGRTLNHIAGQTSQTVYGFDSFEGLPEDWRPDFQQGAFATSAIPEILPNAKLVVGWFDKTLPGFAAENDRPISLLHVDCDLYSSTRTIFYYLSKHIVSGTIIVFDEYFNYIGWREHEYKAFQEFIAASGLRYRYIGMVSNHQQVAVEILGA